MKWACNLGYSPPLPRFLQSGDFRGFKGPVSCVESTGFKLIDSNRFGSAGNV